MKVRTTLQLWVLFIRGTEAILNMVFMCDITEKNNKPAILVYIP